MLSAICCAWIAAALTVAHPAVAADWRWSGVERIVAISDVHGAYPAMVKTLQNAGILDGEMQWAGGSAHLVITGDILDRGAASRQVMDLLMAVERQAADSGGRVHLLLGNHEVMNLVGDLRYVAAGEYAAFAPDEDAADRERAWEAFRSARAAELDEDAIRRQFEMRAPPGYFGHRRAFAPDGRYGKWLLGKPLLVVINDTAFVHGGLSPLVTELGLDGVNRELKSQVTEYASHIAKLAQEGVLDPTENFFRHAEVLGALPESAEWPAAVADGIAGVIRLSAASVYDSHSPIWYRGNAGCSAVIENDKLDAALAELGAARVVIGHTPTPGRRVLHRLDGRVIEIDTGMLTTSYGGSGHALIIEGDNLSVLSESGSTATAPAEHPRAAPPEIAGLPVAELERFLATGETAAIELDGAGRSIVEVRRGKTRIAARFIRNSRKNGVAPELAAYRMDRLLNLDMVPITVSRQIDGDDGSLQILPGNAQTEETRMASGEGAAGWCPLPEQWNSMYVFDALAYNAMRHPQNMLYIPGSWQLMLLDHGKAFASKSGRPEWLKKAELQVGDSWIKAISSLSDDVLQAEFGDLLDKRQLKALAKRRDALLKGTL